MVRATGNSEREWYKGMLMEGGLEMETDREGSRVRDWSRNKGKDSRGDSDRDREEAIEAIGPPSEVLFSRSRRTTEL
jgi:hypothetical protein